MSDDNHVGNEEVKGAAVDVKAAGAPGVVVVPEDPAAPSRLVSSKRQNLSDLFTIVEICKTQLRCFADRAL